MFYIYFIVIFLYNMFNLRGIYMNKFLAEIFVDFYEQQLMAIGEIKTQEEFDDLFYDDEGEMMSD